MKGGSGGDDFLTRCLKETIEKEIDPMECIISQYITAKYGAGPDVVEDPTYTGAIQRIESMFNEILGQDVEKLSQSDDFYVKWVTGGVGHALAVFVSESSKLVPGAGFVGMIHQLFTDKFGPKIARKLNRIMQSRKYNTMMELSDGLDSIKQSWIQKLPEYIRGKYESEPLLESIFPVDV